MQCEICGIEIPIERLEAVSGTTTCVAHSDTHRRVGFMVAMEECAPVLMIVPDGEAYE